MILVVLYHKDLRDARLYYVSLHIDDWHRGSAYSIGLRNRVNLFAPFTTIVVHENKLSASLYVLWARGEIRSEIVHFRPIYV